MTGEKEEKKEEFATKVDEEKVNKDKVEEAVKKRLQILMIVRDPLTARIVELKNVQNVPQMNDACQLLTEALEEYKMQKAKIVLKIAFAETFKQDKKGRLLAP